MKTSYFAKSGSMLNAVSIAGKAPTWYKGREYKKLAPKYWFFSKYKNEDDEHYMDEEFYTEQFQKEVLDPLDPQEIFDDLGEDSVILCWEGKDKFCHRHLVADWLSKNLDIEIEEIGV